MENLYKEMVALLQHGESFAVATIFDTSGSAPRDAGAKMIVRADGSIIGTIGGGRLEARAIARATEIIPARKTEIQSFDLTSTDAAGSDMICGGTRRSALGLYRRRRHEQSTDLHQSRRYHRRT